MSALTGKNTQITFTPWSLSREDVQKQFSSFDFQFERPGVSGEHIAMAHPDTLGCSMENELIARWQLLRSHCNYAYGPKSSKLFNRLTKMAAGLLPFDEFRFVVKADQRISQQDEITFLKSIFKKLEQYGITPAVERHRDRKVIRENMISTLLMVRKQIYREYVDQKEKLEQAVNSVGCLGYENIKLPFCPNEIMYTDRNNLYLTISSALRATTIIKKNIAWIFELNTLKEEYRLQRIKFVEDKREFKAPQLSELAELERSKKDSQPLPEMEVWRKLNGVGVQQSNKIFTAISKLQLDEQRLWHIYEDIAGKDLGRFAAEVLEPSDEVLAAVDTEVLFLRRQSGLLLKQFDGSIFSSRSLAIWHLRAVEFIIDKWVIAEISG